jgi:sensor c-di-GMP phosphodiesterase-like protein
MTMLISRKSMWIVVVSMLVATAGGEALALLVGHAIILHTTRRQLQGYAERVLANNVAYSREARVVLAKMSSSPYPHCSDAALHHIRNLVYQAAYIKEAGSIAGDFVDCSANMGRLAQPRALPRPLFIQHDGISVYKNLSPPDRDDPPAIGLRKGDSYIVFDSHNYDRVTLQNLHYTTTESDTASHQTGQLGGEEPETRGMTLTEDFDGRLGSTLYSTRCSIEYTECATTYFSTSEAMHANRGEVAGNLLLGGLFGIFLGLFCSGFYLRSNNLEQQLRRAIARDQLKFVYQPIVELPSGRIVGAEALARWSDEQGQPVSPEVFIRIAENRGLIREITRLVVRHALADFATTLRARPAFRLSFNAAADDLSDPGFLPMLECSLFVAEVPASSLTIELTESSTVRHEVAIETIRQLRQRGHAVHIDDFGIGYSSLSYLHKLSVDAIKIDRSFTQAIGTAAVTEGILPQILGMASALKLAVVVEGVETAAQAAYFAGTAGRFYAQGWLFGRPKPAADFMRLLTENEARSQCPAA